MELIRVDARRRPDLQLMQREFAGHQLSALTGNATDDLAAAWLRDAMQGVNEEELLLDTHRRGLPNAHDPSRTGATPIR